MRALLAVFWPLSEDADTANWQLTGVMLGLCALLWAMTECVICCNHKYLASITRQAQTVRASAERGTHAKKDKAA